VLDAHDERRVRLGEELRGDLLGVGGELGLVERPTGGQETEGEVDDYETNGGVVHAGENPRRRISGRPLTPTLSPLRGEREEDYASMFVNRPVATVGSPNFVTSVSPKAWAIEASMLLCGWRLYWR
jgi:hypothetical protein